MSCCGCRSNSATAERKGKGRLEWTTRAGRGTASLLTHDYVSGSSRLYGIVGDPVRQVRSPEMITAELRRRGRDAILVPIHVRPTDFDTVVGSLLRIENLDGLVFTIPYKAAALRLADRLGPQAQAVGAINALTRDDTGQWVGEIFDGLGCVVALRKAGYSVSGRRVTLIGAGGAGSAIGVAIAREIPALVRVHDIDRERANSLAKTIAGINPTIEVEVGPPDVEDTDFLLNASPVGMLDDPGCPVDADRLPTDLVVLDAIVKPEVTRLIALAGTSGCHVIRGRQMMRGQIGKMADFFEGRM